MVVAAGEKGIGRRVPLREGPRRAVDFAVLGADPSRIKEARTPKHDDIGHIIGSALERERRSDA